MLSLWEILAGAAVILVAARMVAAYRSQHLFPKSLEEMIAMGAAKAVQRAHARYETELDYSLDSIHSVETVLGKLHETYLAAPQLVDVNSMAFVFGAYVGEAIRRNYTGARWERSHDVAGKDAYLLHWGECTCFPMEWCMKRIAEGAEDNVWAKYEVLANMEKGDAHEVGKSRAASAGGSSNS